MDTETDPELLERWRGGDARAGNALLRRHFDGVSRFFETKAPGADVDDLVQRTFLSCVRAADQFAGRSSFRTYLFTVARHELYRCWRRRRRDGDALDFGVTSLVDLATTPTGRIAREQDGERLLRALRSLPLDQQILLELHYWEDMGIGELAEVFEIASGAMRGRLFRARAALRERVQALADAPAAARGAGPPGGDGGDGGDDFEAWARSMRRRWSDRDRGGGEV